MASRMGADIGGTFTDLAYYDERTGEVRVAKVLTTPARPEEGCLDGVNTLASRQSLEETEYFLHGTTVGLNALLERRGAVVGLITTAGFRDVLEIARGDRAEMYNLTWKPRPPLVPRHRRIPIDERICADGSVLTPINQADVERALHLFEKEGVSSIAISLINAYANPAHELVAESTLRDAGYLGQISLSHRVSGEYREYERTNTTVIDAFVRARMAQYLSRLGAGLSQSGFSGATLVNRSGGGAITFQEAGERPIETIMSGPVAGAQGAAGLARRLGIDGLVTADVGGTSFDSCLILNGRPQLMYEGNILGLPLQVPWVDVRSIGAGGGSVAYVDDGGLMRVGPRSAGATPGPPCYGRGGVEPTVTDAAFFLGMLGDGRLASGLLLNREKAEQALQSLASRLSRTTDEVARGIIEIVGASMANTIRELTVEQGIDPRELTLLAFGGAGPVLAVLLAQELGIRQTVVPPVAGNFSAYSLLDADIVRTVSRTRLIRLSASAIAQVNDLLGELFRSLQSRHANSVAPDSVAREVALDMRYLGQEHSLTVAVPTKDGQLNQAHQELAELFGQEYFRYFRSELTADVEIVAVRATTRISLPTYRLTKKDGVRANAMRAVSSAHSFTRGTILDFALIDREALRNGDLVTGPAIITELTTKTYLDAGFEAEVHPSGSLFIREPRC